MSDRQKALDEALKTLEKNFGAGTALRMSDSPRHDIAVIPTGSIALDQALGINGYPRGRLVEIYGSPSSGKTTLALHAAANVQAGGGTVAFIDAEHAIDPRYCEALGVDLTQVVLSQPDTGEQGLEVADTLVRSGAVDLLVIDSVAAMVPRAEIEGEYGDSHVGLHARLWSQAMRKIVGPLEKTNTTAILINQTRDKIGVVWGSPEVTTGGKAIPFYASVRLSVSRIATEKSQDEATGNRTRVKVQKNKLAAPYRQAEFTIEYGEGISRPAEILDYALDFGLVGKKGAWFSFGGENVAQGRVKAIEWLKGDQLVADALEAQIRERL